MNKIYAVIINETRKIMVRKKTMILMLISALIPGIMAALVLTLQQQLGILALGSVDFPIWILGYFTSILLPLFIFMWTSDSFAGEIEDQSLKTILLRPVTRFKIYLGKIIAIVICTIINLATVLVFSGLAAFFMGFFKLDLASGSIHTLLAYLVAIIPLAFLIVMAAFIAQFFRSSSGSLLTCILIYLVARSLPVVSPSIANILPSAYLNWYSLWVGSIIRWEQILYSLLFMLGSGIIFFTGGFYLFDRKEL